MRAIRIEKTGGPEVLQLVELPTPVPGPGQVLLRHTAIGVNFIDTYQRSGLYPLSLPSGIGNEAVGVVEALGPDVDAVRVGDRVAYFSGPPGAYADGRLIDAAQLMAVPDSIPDDVAVAVWLKGATVEYLVERCAMVRPGEDVLVTAASGGVGTLLSSWLKHIGARPIGVVGSEAKVAMAREHGAADVIVGYAGMAEKVRTLTGGRGVRVVLDGVGKDSFMESLASLHRRGILVTFGNASGPPPAIAPLELSRRGSLFLTRPTLGDYYATPEDRALGIGRLVEMVERGVLRPAIGRRYRLEETAQAHRDLEARATTGASIIIP